MTGCDRCSKRTRSANLPNGNIVCWSERNLTTYATKWVGLATKKPCSISCTTTAQSSTGQGSLAIASYSTRIGRWRRSTRSSTEKRYCRYSEATDVLVGPISKLLIWSGYTPEEQKVFLGMMESCGICFRVRELPQQEQLPWWDKEWEYIAPELLPTWSEAQKSLLTGRIPKGLPMAEAEARYAFLHEGVLRGYLSKIGQQAGDCGPLLEIRLLVLRRDYRQPRAN